MSGVTYNKYWSNLIENHWTIEFVDVTLRGYGQVMFQNNPLTGLFFMVAIFLGGFAENIPQVGFACLLATSCATLTAYCYKLENGSLRAGIYGYNGCLVGVALSTFLSSSGYLWAVIIFASMFSVVVTQSLTNILKIWSITPLTAPFVVVTWIILLSSYSFFSIKGAALSVPISPKPYLHSTDVIAIFASLIPDIFRGISEVFLLSNIIVGIFFIIGLTINSLWSAFYALLGSAISVIAAILLQSNLHSVDTGLYSFSAVLTAIAIGSVFNKPSILVTIYTILGVIFTIFAQGALNTALTPIGIPTLTMPFVLATWFFLVPNKSFTMI